jgi:hypothetical protein
LWPKTSSYLGCGYWLPQIESGYRRRCNSAPTKQTAPGKKPNILLLCIDDLSDWVGYNNAHPGVHTPNIDRLRAQSYSFNSALSANHYLFE